MRGFRTFLALCAALVVIAAAVPPVTTFPAQFANHERIVAVGEISGNGIYRRSVQRAANDDVIVFDDAANLHVEDPDATGPQVEATWRCPSRRVVVFTMTPDTVAALKAALSDGVPFPLHVSVAKARLTFGRKLLAYSGTQVIRCTGRYRGFQITITETIRYSGTRVPGKTVTAAESATLKAALTDAVARIAQRFPWTTSAAAD